MKLFFFTSLLFVVACGGNTPDTSEVNTRTADGGATTGSVGPQGDPGKDGTPGKNGVDGTNGKDGLTGPAGVNGTNGKDGLPGAPGTPGKDGLAGPAGAPGIPGTATAKGDTGAKGDKGDKGDTGSAGPAGTPGTPGATSGASMYVSGSRIRAQFFDTPDGAHGFSSWYDTKISYACMPQTTADGKTRCLPQNQVSLWDAAGTGYYLNPGCKGSPVVLARADGVLTKYATGLSQDYPVTNLIREVGEAVVFDSLTTGLYYGNPNRGCGSDSFMNIGFGTTGYYKTKNSVALTEFVEMTETVE